MSTEDTYIQDFFAGRECNWPVLSKETEASGYLEEVLQKDLDLTSTFFLASCPCSLPGTQTCYLQIQQPRYELEDKVHILRIRKQGVDEALTLAGTYM